MTFGEALRAARGDRSLATIGKAAGCSPPFLLDVENGRRRMGPDVETRVLAALGLDAAAVARLRALAAVARGTVDVRGLRPDAVARVLMAIERERAREDL